MDEVHFTEALTSQIAFIRVRQRTGREAIVSVDRIVMIQPVSSGRTELWIDLGVGHGYTLKLEVQETVDEVLAKIKNAQEGELP